jgi:cobalamin biosynthesis protein CobW
MIVLNKTDLLADGEVAKVSNDLKRQIRPGTRVVPARHGALESSALLGFGASAESDVSNRLSHHEMEGEEQHDHDDFVTFVVSMGEAADRETLLTRVKSVAERHDVLRMKGFVALKGQPSRLLVQAVGPRLTSYFDRAWKQDEERRSDVVVIGLKGLDRIEIEAALRG